MLIILFFLSILRMLYLLILALVKLENAVIYYKELITLLHSKIIFKVALAPKNTLFI